jgi:hypothetical protein
MSGVAGLNDLAQPRHKRSARFTNARLTRSKAPIARSYVSERSPATHRAFVASTPHDVVLVG